MVVWAVYGLDQPGLPHFQTRLIELGLHRIPPATVRHYATTHPLGLSRKFRRLQATGETKGFGSGGMHISTSLNLLFVLVDVIVREPL